MRTLSQIKRFNPKSRTGWLFAAAFLLFVTGFAQEFRSFDIRYQDNLKGELTFIANNILNRSTGSDNPEDPYNYTGNSSQYNDYLNMQYIDVDGDPTTFSSSSATFTYPDNSCNLIRYAGLYWSATYPSETSGQPIGFNRQNDFNQVKLKLPGGGYLDIVADEILYDGNASSDITMQLNSPYACYADVTSLLSGISDPQGEYTVANVRATTGSIGGGASAGWTLVIVYENPTLTGKHITTFDGFARVRRDNPQVDIDYNGFNTIPVGPVRANIGVAALEGDNRITGDQLRIKAASNGGFTTLSDPVNASNNFFNSNITQGGSLFTARNPNSVNTLGYDTDMFLLNNPMNSVLPNSESSATFRFTSDGDQYYPFFNSFNVEVIEPEMILKKRVEDIAGNDITGGGVNLGQVLDYVLSFQNQGNDDATDYVIKDILPINVVLDESNLNLPPGATYTYNSLTRELNIAIPDNLVEAGDPFYDIRIRVQVSENCYDFVDACSDIIQNLAYSTYRGVINSNQITDDPSVSDFDACGFVIPGATNFLLDDLSDCGFFRSLELCGNDLTLDAGDNFDDYIWYRDNNANGQIDAGDTVITDGDPDNDPSTLHVTQAGQYIVDKIVADPCKGFQEVIEVTLPGVTQFNPIVDLINDPLSGVDGEISICPNDGQPLPKIFLCGLNDAELIQINIPDASSIVWEKLDEGSCMDAGEDCANKNSACTWSQVDTGNDFLAAEAGEYRVVVNYQNGCFTRFYFNVFKNELDPQFNVSDILCTTPGNITVTNVPAGYEFQLLDANTGTILVPYSANNGPSFSIDQSGAYTVEIRQLNVTGGCLFYLEDIGVRVRDFDVEITPTDVDCNGMGAINIAVLDVEPQYYFELSQSGAVIDTYGPVADNQYQFQNLVAGTYTISVTTDDGCEYNQQVTIADVSDLEASALTLKPIDCEDGIIEVTGTGGFPNPDYLYAVWSVNGADLYTNVADIPADSFQNDGLFMFTPGQEGEYQFVVVDANNCFALTNTVEIALALEPEYTLMTLDETCFGAADGAVSVSLTDSHGYSISYTLELPDGSLLTNASGTFTGLGQGSYQLTITRTLGNTSCDTIENITLSGPAEALTADSALIQTYTCLQQASIQAVSVQGGTAPYSYALNGGVFQTSDTFAGLTEGSYTLVIRDANGCEFTTAPVVVLPLQLLEDLQFTETAVTCPDQTSDVTVTAIGGTAPFAFEIIAPLSDTPESITGSEATFNALAPGTYTFRVTDSNGCSYEESHTIYPITPITAAPGPITQISCFGASDGAVSFAVSGFETTYNYAITGPQNWSDTGVALDELIFSNLPSGVYTITLSDPVTGCESSASATIESPLSSLEITANGIQPTCTEDGAIQLSATGGWGGNSFTLTYPDGTVSAPIASGNFQGLTQIGTYIAQVQDANGCVASTSFTLIAVEPPSIELVANTNCYVAQGGLTLVAYLTAGIGDGNFRYRINGGAYGASNIFTGLGPGTYTVEVIDRNNCSDSATITINPELSVSALAETMSSCASDAQVSYSAAGGDGNYVFAVLPAGSTPADGDFTASADTLVTQAGDYQVFVRDHSGNVGYCQAVFDLTVNQEDPLSITTDITNVLCYGNSTGEIEILVGGGSAPYSFSLNNGASYQAGNVFYNLAAGTYPIRVRDAAGCEISALVTVSEAAPLAAEAQVTQDYTCLIAGEITVGSLTPTSGGSGSYQYRVNGGAWTAATSGGFTFGGLLDGSYTIQVRDALSPGCTLTLPELTVNPLPVTPILSTNLGYNCDGTAEVEVFPIDSSFMYSVDGLPFQSSNTFQGLAVGNHTLTVDYGSGCTVQSGFTVSPGFELQSQLLSVEDAACAGAADGNVQFRVLHFNPAIGYVYQINGGGYSTPQFTQNITLSGLVAGNYTIQIQDAGTSACETTVVATVNEPLPVTANVSLSGALTCTNSGASLTASATGGTPGYSYQLENLAGTILVGYQNNAVFTGIPEGEYRVRVLDARGCEAVSTAAVTVVAPQEILFDVTPTLCYSGNGDGQLQVAVNQGNGGYTFSLNGGPWMSPTPASATTYVFSNLTAGSYQVRVRDSYGCETSSINTVIHPALRATAQPLTALTCLDDATLEVLATGGTGNYAYEWSNDGGLTWNINNFSGNVFQASVAGTYLFRITDTTSSCQVITSAVWVEAPVPPVISSVTASQIFCFGDNSGALTLTLDPNTGFSPFSISVTETGTGTDYGNQTTGLPAGNYAIVVTDAKGCASDPYLITITQPDPILHDVIIEPISCDATGITPGSITVQNVTGGSGSYTYSLSGNNGFTAQFTAPSGADYTFGPLPFGIYELNVVDTNGCAVQTTNIIASPPDDLDIDVSTLTADCASGGTAVVTVSSLVGSGNYEFAILETYALPYASTFIGADTAGGYTATFTGLVPGITYTFVVHDLTNDCYYFESAAAPVNTPSGMAVTALEATDVTCTGAADGSVSFEVTGYDPGASQVFWELFNFQSNTPSTPALSGTLTADPSGNPIQVSDIGPLAPGVYYVLLSEIGGPFNGCSVASADFTISQSVNLLQLTAVSPVNDNCNPNAGQILATAQFGTAPYQYQFRLASAPAPLANDASWSAVASSNVESGDYMAYVKDARGCIQGAPVTVILDPQPEVQLNVLDYCVEEGAFEVQIDLITAGVAPYQVSVNGGPFQTTTLGVTGSYVVSGLSSGLNQTITVRDRNGCIDTQSVSIYPPLEFTATLTQLLDCEPGMAGNAEISIQVNQGSGAYEFEIAGPVSQARTALPANPYLWNLANLPGTYTVTVYDISTPDPSCLGVVQVEVPEALLPEFTTQTTDLTCAGSDDGSIQIVPTANGTGPWSYTLIPGAGSFNAVSNSFEDLPVGTYTILATGANACSYQIDGIQIAAPLPVLVPNPVITPFACSTGNTPNSASISIVPGNVSGGSGTYVHYEFINTQGTADLSDDVMLQSGSNPVFVETNLAGGSYLIRVYDSNGCSGATTATLSGYDALLSLDAQITNPLSCVPGMDGEITLIALTSSGNTSLLEYSKDGGLTWQSDPVFAGLDAGVYNFAVRNTNTGCAIAVLQEIVVPEPLEVEVTVLQDQSCYGTDSGVVTFELQDAIYTGGFDWWVYNTNGTPSDSTDDNLVLSGNSANNGPTPGIDLSAGVFRVVVSQSQLPGCTQEQQFEISGPDAPIVGQVALSPISCYGNDGVLEFYNVSGGSGMYMYYVGTTPPVATSDFVNTPRFENLSPGNYAAWVMDSFGCQTQVADQLALTDPSPIVAQLQINQENCTEFEGELEVVGVTGGMGSNYTYQLIRNGVPVGVLQTNPVFGGLGAGVYQVQITDPMGCEALVGPQTLYAELYAVAEITSNLRCDVTDAGAITIIAQGGSANLEYIATYPDGTTTATNTSGIFTGLSQAGDYTFTVTDLDTNAACSEALTATLVAPSAVVLESPEVVHVSCNGNYDGSITVLLSEMEQGINDNPAYSYALFLQGSLVAGPQSTPLFDGLAAGTYSVEVTSALGCVAQQEVQVNEPNPLALTLTATPFSCDAGNVTSTATVVANVPVGAGTAPYLFSINGSNYQTSNSFEVADQGVAQHLTVYVKDQQGCVVSEPITLEPLNRFVPSVTELSALNCANPGQLQVNVSDNGNSLNTYSFELLPLGNPNGFLLSNPSNTAAVFEITAPGNYVFRVTDSATGCWELTAPFEIAPFDLISAEAVVLTSEVCYGDLQGSLSVDISNYSGNFEYEVFELNGISTGITGMGTAGSQLLVSGLGGGSYYVEITETDAPFCAIRTNTVSIQSPSAALSAVLAQIAPVTCTDTLGEIQVLPQGGYAPYTVVLVQNGTNQTYQQLSSGPVVFGNLSAATYTAQITDQAGCVFEANITLDAPEALNASAVATPDVLACFGDTNGTVTAVQVSGGSGSYQYRLQVYDPSGSVVLSSSGYQSSPIFSGLGAGIYSVTVSDGWSCDLETHQVVISEPSEVSGILAQSTQLTCAEEAEIVLTAFGGTAPYFYSTDGIQYLPMSGGDTHVFSVAPGTYQYFVRDAFGCGTQRTNQVVVEEIAPLELNLNTEAAVVNCAGEATASIQALASGGLGNYQYTLFGDAALTNVVAGPQDSGIFANLSSGSYWIQATSLDCEVTSPAVVIADPAPLVILQEEALPVTCSGEHDGSIVVEVAGGAGNIRYAISPNLNQFDTKNTFTGLAPGTYQVLAQDQSGCFLLFDFEITAPEPIEVVAVATPEVCAGSADGMIELEITGGQAPYWTALDSNQAGAYVQDQIVFSDLSAGTHVVFVRDSRGCETNVFVTIAPGVNLNATATPIYSCTGSVPDNYLEVVLEDQDLMDEVMYALDSTDPADMQLEPNFTNLAPGQHYVTVFHSNGCYKTVPFEVEAIEGLTLTLAEGNINQLVATVAGGSPAYRFWLNDQDMGTTNSFYISESGTYTVRVMDQNGCVVEAQMYLQYIEIELPDHFSPGGEVLDAHWKPKNTEAYPNILIKIYDRYGRVVADLSGSADGWDGTYNGKPLPTGDYWYVIRLNGELDDREFFGHFTLYR